MTESESKPRRHGPQKEKKQITLRIDKELMDEARLQMAEDRTRITDIIERGLILALEERGCDLRSIKQKHVRFLLADAPREHQVLTRGLAIAMVEGEVLRALKKPVTPEVEKFFEFIKWFLERQNKQPYASACLEYYSNYGKDKTSK